MRTLAFSSRNAQATAVRGSRFQNQSSAAQKARFLGSRFLNGPCQPRHSAENFAGTGAVRAAFETTFPEDTLSLGELKSLLEDTLWGTQRGLSANSDTRAEILDLIAQMEAKTPIPEPNQGAGLNQLGGTWRLVYTSNSELVPILALGRLPLVEVGDITQTIDAASGKVENVVSLSVPFSKTSVGSTATASSLPHARHDVDRDRRSNRISLLQQRIRPLQYPPLTIMKKPISAAASRVAVAAGVAVGLHAASYVRFEIAKNKIRRSPPPSRCARLSLDTNQCS